MRRPGREGRHPGAQVLRDGALMPTTDQDARALTYIAKRLREETYGACRWDEAGIHAVVKQLVGRNLPTVVEQVTRHASDPEAKTPGAINRPFLPEAPKAGPNYPPKRHEECANHPGQWRDACNGCQADKLAGETRPAQPADPRRPDGSEHLAMIRAQLHTTQARLCTEHHRLDCRVCGATSNEETTNAVL